MPLNLLLSALSGALLILSFPRFDFSFLMPFALAPLLVAVARAGGHRERFLCGWMTGALCLVGICPWIRFVVMEHGGLGPAGGTGVFALFCLAKGLYFGFFALLAGYVMSVPWSIPAIAAAWVAVDATLGSAGFVWITLAHAGLNMGVPMRLAPITGANGISFLFVLMSATLAAALMGGKRRQILWLLLLPLMILLPPLPDQVAGERTAVVLQPNVSESATWTPEEFKDLLRRSAYDSFREALRAGERPADLLVWPEVPAPFYYDRDTMLREAMSSLARQTALPFLFGMVGEGNGGAVRNSAQYLSSSGSPVARYDKVHLVPFGEYVPWPFGFASKISPEVGDFQPGEQAVVVPVRSRPIGAFICYESAFAGHVRSFVRGGAEFLVNLSNDGYFGDSNAREQHLLVVRMRAIENRRWILRATNSGITAAVDPSGRYMRLLPDFRAGAARAPFNYIRETTFYTMHGDWFAYLCIGFTACTALWAWRSTSLPRA